jgi:ABC-type oligopeptide transport system ATPase subunit
MPLAIDRATTPLLRVNGAGRDFAGRGWGGSGGFRAVDDVSLEVWRGETLGIVGESGSGKSTLGRMIAGLLTPTRGQVLLDGEDVHGGSGARKRAVWRRMQMVFQDPYSSLNPRMTVRDALLEPMRNFGVAQGQAAEDRARRLLDACGLPSRSLNLFPREFSGGQRQRIGIARALAVQPDLIVADEPVSALDVSVQAQVINLMMDLQAEFGLTYVFIAHDLAVVRQIADRVGVMNKGCMVELAASEALFASPVHAYTKTLLASSPVADPRRARQQLVGAVG